MRRKKLKKIIILATLLSLLLFACSEEPNHIAEEDKEKAVTDHHLIEEIEDTKEDEKELPSSLEEWQSTLDNSEWYKEVQVTGEILFERFLDFKGDGLQEVIIGTRSAETNEAFIKIGEYINSEWSTLYEESHNDLPYVEPHLLGVLDNGDGTEVIAISIFSAGASAVSEEFRILKYRNSSSQERIVTGFHHIMAVHSPETYLVDEEEQKITINEEFGAVNYTLVDNILVNEDGYGKRLYTGKPFTTNQKFIDLLDNTYFDSGTFFGDSSVDAEMNDENLIHKDAHEGGYNSQFQDYAVMYGYFDPTIDYIVLFGFDNLLVSELEEVIGQKLEIESSYSAYEDAVVTYANFLFDGYRYHAEITRGEHNVIDKLTISNDLYLE